MLTGERQAISGRGRAWVEMDCNRDKDSILRAIKSGDFWNCFQKTV